MNYSDFTSTMEAMRYHLKTHPLTVFPMPISLSGKVYKEEELPMPARAILLEQEGVQREFYGNQQAEATKNTEKYLEDKDLAEFRERMNAERRKAKESANKNIDKAFDKLIEVGEEASEEGRSMIVLATVGLTTFATKLLNDFTEWAVRFVDTILEYFREALKKIEEYFGVVTDSIDDFFSRWALAQPDEMS